MILCDYTCETCGTFEEVVESPAPDEVLCTNCDGRATWTPTAVLGKVKRVEVQRGKWQKPERKTFYDTRNLGEGQDPAEWRAERRKIRDEQRQREIKEQLR
jgi:hypothetical protein